MLVAMQILTVVFVALAMAPALAHALELPGKMRLPRREYFAVQHIYYPGFTIGGGIGEVGGFVATVLLVFLTPRESVAFYLSLAALGGLIAMQAVYWVLVHPVNKVWLESALEGKTLSRLGSGFFSLWPNAADRTPGDSLDGSSRSLGILARCARRLRDLELYSPGCFHPPWCGCGTIVSRRNL
jgi:hypothetical protein